MILVIAAIFLIDYSLIKRHLINEGEEELKQRCENIHLRIQKSLNSAIENYLRGITEANLEIVEYHYQKFENGEVSESEAKNTIQKYCNQQKIGNSGYFVAVENRNGRLILDIHPYKRHEDCSDEIACMIWDTLRNGYTEYDWKNPEDNVYRKKVAYVKEFPEWNWVFGTTSYKSEFTQLLNIQDLKNILASEKIKGSGYAILYDSATNAVFHPMLEKYKDESFLTSQSNIIESILTKPGEVSFYQWKNPGDKKAREKYAYTEKIPEFNFFLVVTGYMDEIYSPLNRIVFITILLSVTAALLLLLSIILHSRKLVNPILKIIEGIKQYNANRTLFKVPETSVKEIRTLAHSFQNMTKEIDKQIEEKQRTIARIQEINRELEIAMEKAEESDRLKSAFLANMSHEIRTPMNGILGFTNLLKNSDLTIENQSRYLQIIEKSGQRMLNTLNDIIDISKIEAGHIEVFNSMVSINNILEELYIFFHEEAIAKGLELSYKTELKESESRCFTDRQKLESILTNLIKNAIKYTEKGNIEYGCSAKKSGNRELLEFFVSDTGIGIPRERIGTIFNRFEQVETDNSSVYEGSGLGLSISKSYVEILGGSIAVSSEQGKGTIFRFSIPCNKITSEKL
jgi:signal transduction histidine kinase